MHTMNRLKVIFFLCIGVIFFSPFLRAEDESLNGCKAKKYNLSVCALFKDEAKYLKEWLEYHKLVGVDHFYLYNNNSSDQYMSILKKYIQDGVVTLVQWPYQIGDSSEENDLMWIANTQIAAYENAARFRAVKETKWLVFVDLNEYLLSPNTQNLREVLEKYDAYPGVILARDHFDTAADGAFQKQGLVIETETKTAPNAYFAKTVEKTIFKPDQYEYFLWDPYQCIFKDNQKAINLSKKEMRVNRYVNRSKRSLFSGNSKEYAEVGMKFSASAEGRELEEDDEVFNEENTIQRYVPDVRQKVGIDR